MLHEVVAEPDVDVVESSIARGSPRRNRWLKNALLFALVSAGRWGLAYNGSIPELAHDEHAQLAVARVVSGAGSWTMVDLATWQPGFGLLIAPLAALIDDPENMYRSALIVNCLLGGLGAVLFAALVRRVLAISYTFSLLLAGIVTLSPGLIRTSALAWAEPGVFLTFTATLLCLVEAHRSRHVRWSVLAVLVGSLGYLFHGRMLPIAIVTVPVAVHLAWRSSRSAAVAGAVALLGVLTIGSVRITSSRIVDELWTDPFDQNSAGATLSRLKDPLSVGVALIGQLWYLQASTLGLFGVGAVVVIAASIRRPWAGEVLTPVVARIALVIIAAAIATSALFMSGREDRADYAIYGRYNDAVSGLFIAVGIVWLLTLARASARRYALWTFAGLVTLAAALAMTLAVRGEVSALTPLSRTMVNGITPFVFGAPRDLVAVTVSSAMVALMLYLVIGRFARRPVILVCVAVVLVMAGGIRIWDVHEHSRNKYAAVAAVAEVENLVPDGQPIGIELSTDPSDGLATLSGSRIELSSIQFFLPSRQLVPLKPGETSIEYVFGTRDAPALEREGDVVWSTAGMGLVLWRVHTASS